MSKEEQMGMLGLGLKSAWRRCCNLVGLRFDLAGIALDDVELAQQLGYGRD